MHTQKNTYQHIQTHTNTRTHTHSLSRTHTHAYAHTHTHSYVRDSWQKKKDSIRAGSLQVRAVTLNRRRRAQKEADAGTRQGVGGDSAAAVVQVLRDDAADDAAIQAEQRKPTCVWV